METNPFDDEADRFFVLVNDEEQHSLWPSSVEVPAGWHVVFGADDRSACLESVAENWVDMRPRSLRAAMVTNNSQQAS
ncbi:MbtH family protein [Kibdelosporangium lantanae]|uniref:MbtH family protein n=1 Tax=Kibdelosporangium lantanae TaxID=1497396 RepID=A0ABW3M1J7_9PSEU